MAQSGQVIENVVTRERIKFLRTGEETGGELSKWEVFVEPGGFAAAEHIHPEQEERFQIVSGRMRARIRGVERVLEAGDTLVILPGVPHVWQNAGTGTLRMVLEFRPALKSERFFETFFQLARDGKTNRKGLPNLLQIAVLMGEYAHEIRLTRPPWIVQRAVFAILAPLARWLGFRAYYPQAQRTGA